MNLIDNKKNIEKKYQSDLKTIKKFWKSKEVPNIHYGFYEKNCTNFTDASINMNIYIENILKLKNMEKDSRIIDIGCGIGGPTIYFAKKYPNLDFIGIDIISKFIDYANSYVKENDIDNVKFFKENYLDTNFSNDYFEKEFSLFSASHCKKIDLFIKEMNRILKKEGEIVIVDIFVDKEIKNIFLKNVYNSYLKYNALTFIPKLKDFESFFKKTGFKNIKIEDISKNVIRPHLITYIGLFLTLFFMIKKFNKIKKNNSLGYHIDNIIDSTCMKILAKSSIIKFCVITATKK